MSANFKNPVIRWIDHRLPVFTFLHHEANEYPTPKNLSYWWNFGSLAGFMLVVMMASGIFLAMQYTPHVDHAFNHSFGVFGRTFVFQFCYDIDLQIHKDTDNR